MIEIREYVEAGAAPNTFKLLRTPDFKPMSIFQKLSRRTKPKYLKIPLYRFNSWYLTETESECVRLLYPNARKIVRIYRRYKNVDLSDFLRTEDHLKIINEDMWLITRHDTTGALWLKTIILR